MPIGEAHKSGGSFTGLAEYILAQGIYKYQNDDKKPEVVFKNHVYSSNYLELGAEFREVAKDNARVKKPVMHLTVNFKTSDNISNENQKKFVQKIIEEMGVKENNHQFLVVKHNDKHPHYHIQINRVGFDGKTLSDSNSKLRIGTACDKIEKEMGFDNYLHKTRAFIYDEKSNTYKKNKNRNINKSKTVIKASRNRQVGVQEKKDFIQIETLKALDNHNVKSLKILQNELSKKEISFKYSVNKKEQVAVSFQYKSVAVKGSKISLKGSLIKNQLLANLKANKKLENKNKKLNLLKDIYPNLTKSLDQIMQLYNLGKTPNLNAIFKKNDINYNNDEGTIQYNNSTLNMNFLKRFIEEFNTKLENAKKTYVNDTISYYRLQNIEFKKGFLGFLNSEDKKFNEKLKNRKEKTKAPLLKIGIETNNYKKEIYDNIKKAYQEEKAKKVIRYMLYSIDESIKTTKKKELKPEKTQDNKKSVSMSKNRTNTPKQTQVKAHDLKPTRKRSMRR